MLPPFKEALSKICNFLCYWKSACCACPCNSGSDSSAETLSPNNNDTVLLHPNGTNGNLRNGHVTQNGRSALVISHRELVPGEPPKTARVLRLLNKRRRKSDEQKRPNKTQRLFSQNTFTTDDQFTDVSTNNPSGQPDDQSPNLEITDKSVGLHPDDSENVLDKQDIVPTPILDSLDETAEIIKATKEEKTSGDVVVQVVIENQILLERQQNTDDIVL